MKKIIINLPNTWTIEKANSMIQASFNQDFTEFFATGEILQKLEQIQRVKTYSFDLQVQKSIPIYTKANLPNLREIVKISHDFGVYLEINNKQDESTAIELAKGGVNLLICKATNWKIIPFENLIANISTLDTQLIADVGDSLTDVDILLRTLEKGVDGILFTPSSESDFGEIKKMLKQGLKIPLDKAQIKKITAIPEADRVCVDTSSMLLAGEGMLVGNTAKGFALVHAEVFESEFVNSRPFRVNAGDVSEYVLVPEFQKDGSIKYRTSYLSELKAGDKVLIVNTKGETRIVSVGRVKIETRPMLLFELVSEIQGKKISLFITVQNAETIRLVGENGDAISCTMLKIGDKILVHIGPGATHFGTAIKETIIEK